MPAAKMAASSNATVSVVAGRTGSRYRSGAGLNGAAG